MNKDKMVIIADYSEESSPLSFEELCEICHISSDFINQLIDYEIIHPQGESPNEWVFDLDQLQRIKTTLRLQHDLDVNLAGVVVVLDLLEQLDEIRERIKLFEKHYL
jgi:chaperone modulatory protein CbpM